MDLSIVVPCYNEAGNLPGLIDRFRELIAKRPGVEVVLVNNGSTDDSAAVFAVRLRPGERVRVVNVPVNRGYGFGILSGLREAKGNYLAWTHADRQTDPGDVLAAFDLVRVQKDAGKCFVRGRPAGRGSTASSPPACRSSPPPFSERPFGTSTPSPNSSPARSFTR
jgi:glycosyltransferase involved in cell wall biosynthesis